MCFVPEAGIGVAEPVVLAGPFRCARFYAIPFCVSSLSSIATGNKGDFDYLFPKDAGLLALALGFLFGWPLLVFSVDRVVLRMERQADTPGKAPPVDGGASA